MNSWAGFLFTYPGRATELALIALAIFFGVFEYAYSRWLGRPVYEGADTRVTLGMYMGYLLSFLILIPPLAMGMFTWLNSVSPFSVGRLWWYFMGNVRWYEWLYVFLAVDFVFYWFHRCSHHYRLLWTSHAGHHTSQQFNLSVGFRQAWTPFFWLAFSWPLALLGVDAKLIAMTTGLNLTYQTLIHTQLIKNFGPLDWILNSPSHHRVHHGSNPQYIDKNFGGVLIVWDRLFGTFAAETTPVQFGMGRPMMSVLQNVFGEWIALFRDVRRQKNLRDKLKVLIASPGFTSQTPH